MNNRARIEDNLKVENNLKMRQNVEMENKKKIVDPYNISRNISERCMEAEI